MYEHFINAYVHAPYAVSLVPVNAGLSTLVVLIHRLVLAVYRMRNLAQICDSVVVSLSVLMVQLACGIRAMHVQPRQDVRSGVAAVYTYCSVPLPHYVSRAIPGLNYAPAVHTPSEHPRIWVVVQ